MTENFARSTLGPALCQAAHGVGVPEDPWPGFARRERRHRRNRLIRAAVAAVVAALVATLAIAAFGVHAYLRTPVVAFPDVTNLQVNVITQMPGLAPPEIERQITIPTSRFQPKLLR